MKKLLTQALLLPCLFVLVATFSVDAQCVYSGHDIAPTSANARKVGGLASDNFIDNNVPKHTAFPLDVCSNSTWRFQTCGGLMAPATPWNTILTVIRDDGTGNAPSTNPADVIVFNDDAGGGCGTRSRVISHLFTTTEKVWVLIDTFGCDTTTTTSATKLFTKQLSTTEEDSVSKCGPATVQTFGVNNTAQTFSTQCRGNFASQPSCISDSLNALDIVYDVTSTSGGFQNMRVFLENCTSQSDSIYVYITDTVKTVGCLNNSCDLFDIFRPSTGTFMSTGLNSTLFDLDDTSIAGGYNVVIDAPNLSANGNDTIQCTVNFELYDALQGFSLDTSGCQGNGNDVDITACADSTFCTLDSNMDGQVWYVLPTTAGLPATTPPAGAVLLSDTTFSPGATYRVCATFYIQDLINGNNHVKRVDLGLGTGWTSITAVSPSGGAPNGFYDALPASVWTSSITGQNINFEFASQSGGGTDGDDNAFFANPDGYNCAGYTFCFEATVGAGVTNEEQLDVTFEITEQRKDSSVGGIDINTPKLFSLNSEFVLPFRDLTISAEKAGNVNVVDWSLFTDLEIDHFIIEKSSNAIYFEEIGRVEGLAGAERYFYNFIDDDPFLGNNYYRIKQIYAEAEMAYSKVVFVHNDMGTGNSLNLINVYPNPTSGQLYIETQDNTTTTYSVNVYSMMGALLRNVEFVSEGRGLNKQMIDFNDLAAGIYAVEIEQKDSGASQNMLIQVY